MAQVFRKVFAPLLSGLEDANRHYGIGILVASCIGTRVRMGLLYRKAIAGVFDQSRLGTSDVTPVAPSPTLIITPDQEPYVRKLPCAPYFAKAAPPRLHWRRLPVQPASHKSSQQKDSPLADQSPLFDLGEKAVDPPQSFKDVARTPLEETLDLLQFPDAITTVFDSDSSSSSSSDGKDSASSPSAYSSSGSSRATLGSILEYTSPSSTPEPPITPPPLPRSLPTDPRALVASGSLPPNPLGVVARGSPRPPSPTRSDKSGKKHRAAFNPYNSHPDKVADMVTSPSDNTYAIPSWLASGGSGIVVLGAQTDTGVCVAIKVMHKRMAFRKMRDQVRGWAMEKRCMQLAREERIRYWAPLLESWHDEHNVFMVMELAFGSLRDKLIDGGEDHIEAKLWCREMLLAIWALRDYHIVHSDIKPDNFLIVNGGSVVLSDFGLAQTPEPALPTTADFLEWRGVPGGTPGYYAPQLLLREGRYVAHKSDIFSLGLVFVEVLSHMGGAALWDVFKLPVEHKDTPDVWFAMPPAARQKWLMDNYWLEGINLSVMSPELDIIEKMLSQIASVEELLQHPCFDDLYDDDGKVKYHHMTPLEMPYLRTERKNRDLMFEDWHRGVDPRASYGPVPPSFGPIIHGPHVVRSRWLKDSEATKRQLQDPFPSDFNWIWRPSREPADESEPEDEPEPEEDESESAA
ncbi:hypothetical protein V8D89_013368 [Ganoderma adspersum]